MKALGEVCTQLSFQLLFRICQVCRPQFNRNTKASRSANSRDPLFRDNYGQNGFKALCMPTPTSDLL